MNESCTKGAGGSPMIAARRVTSSEELDAFLARIAEVDPAVTQ